MKKSKKNSNELSGTVIATLLGVHLISLAIKEHVLLITDCTLDHGQQ